MSEEAKVYTCSVCGKPTPNYHEWSPSVAAILGEQGSSTCDECFRKAQISYKWENEQFAEERLICPYCEISISDPWEYEEAEDETWRMVPDLVSGPARRALVHGRADAPRVTSAQIGETERRARALERDRARALKMSRKAKR